MQLDELKKRFSAHNVDKIQEADMKEIRMMALNLAMLINEGLPDGREKSLAITKLEESVMWANKGISTR